MFLSAATRADGRCALGEPLSATGCRHPAPFRIIVRGGAVIGVVGKARLEHLIFAMD